MSTKLTISDVGLRLIKAYEGFRPVDLELMSGHRVVGYGHRVMNGQNMLVSEAEAEALLLDDLAPYEAMINDSIFAPLTQSQFDALCSLAFNIGPKRFLESDVVRALNNGRVLDAANGFDVWRKAEINNERFIVDALVRRRTAEKVLFLRPSQRAVKAPRVELNAHADADLQGLTTAAPPRVLEDSGLVSKVNFDAASDDDLDAAPEELPWTDIATQDDVTDVTNGIEQDEMFVERRSPARASLQATPMRRRTDHPSGVLTLSEVYDEEEDYISADDVIENDITGDADLPLIEDIEGLNLDIGSDMEKAADEGFDDLVLTEVDVFDVPMEEERDDIRDLDPSELITAHVGRANDDDGVLDLDNSLDFEDMGPSPIAAAAAEVSGRLDALMADEKDTVIETERKILPFRGKTAANSEKLRSDNPLYRSLIESEDMNREADQSDLTTLDPIAHEDDIKKSPDLAAQKDSAARYIANNIAPAQTKARQTGLSLMVIFGMILLAVSVATMLSGYDQKFGAGGEFASTVGAIFGGMISLGCIYYIFKNMRTAT